MIRINKNLLGAFVLILSFFMHSCAKDSTENLNASLNDAFAGIAAFNGIQSTKNLQFLVDGKLINKTEDDFSTGGYLNYRTIFPGKRKIDIVSTGNQIYHKSEREFKDSKFYTYFLFGKNNVEGLVTEDDIIKSNPGKLKIRVVNLVDDLHPIKLDFNYLNSKFSYNFDSRIYGFHEYSSKERFKFIISSTDKKYNDLEISLAGKDRSVNTIVIYTELNNEMKEVLNYKILEL